MWIAGIILLSLMLYLAIGATYARFQSVACYERARYQDDYDIRSRGPIDRSDYHAALGLRLAFWPIMMAVDWAEAPSARHAAKIQRLEQEKEQWQQGRYTMSTPDEIKMMVESLNQQLRELRNKNRREL